jgi:hypothetical protein
MRPVTLTLVGNGVGTSVSAPCPMDYHLNPFQVGMLFEDSGTTTAFTVQHTMDDPADYADATAYNANAHWVNHPFMAAMTAQTDGNYAFPVRAIRLSANGAGADTGTLKIMQAG